MKDIFYEDESFYSYIAHNDDESEKVDKKVINGRVKVTMDFENGAFTVSNSNEPNKIHIKPFRGMQMNGFYDELFNSRSKKEAKSELLYHYMSNNRELSEEEKDTVINRMNHNVDINVYRALYEYDCRNYWKTNKSDKYLEIMLKDVKRKSQESNKHFKEKELRTRQRELRLAGIDLEYDLEGMIFSKNHPLDNLKAIKNAIEGRKFATIKFAGKKIVSNECTTMKKPVKPVKTKHLKRSKPVVKSKAPVKSKNTVKSKTPIKSKTRTPVKTRQPEKNTRIKQKLKKPQVKFQMFDKIKRFKESKVFTAPKGMFEKLSKKVQEKDFKQKVKKVLFTAGIIGMVGLSGLGISTVKSDFRNNNQNAQTSMSYDAPNYEGTSENETVYDIQGETESVASAEIVTPQEENKEIVDVTENTEKVEETSASTVENEVVEAEKQEGEKIVLQDAIFDCLGIDMNSEFSMKSGKYYETPKQTGNSGNYEKYGGNVKLSYIVAIEGENYYQYSNNDGLTVSQIKEAHPDAQISYHVVNADNGMVLGWNMATENNIERSMVNSALMRVKEYLPTETMEFLCNTDLSSQVDSKECEVHFNNLKKAIEQSKEKIDVVENER